MNPLASPSPFFVEQAAALAAAARHGPVLDLACGRGRHSLAAAEAGVRVIAIDRNPEFLAELGHRSQDAALTIARVRSDIENPAKIPLSDGSCGAILVFRFLFRPLAPAIEAALAPGGLLLYETFTLAQLELGSGPRNPRHLLEPGELPRLFPGLQARSYRETLRGGEHPAALAQLAAYKPD